MNKLVSHFDALLDRIIECADRPFSFKEPKRSDELLAIIDKMRQDIDNMNQISKKKPKPSDKKKESRDEDGRRLEDMVRLEDEEEDNPYLQNKAASQDKASMKRALIRKSNQKKTPFDEQFVPQAKSKELGGLPGGVAPGERQRLPAVSSAQNKADSKAKGRKNSSFESQYMSIDKLPSIKSNNSFADEEKKYRQKRKEFKHAHRTVEAPASGSLANPAASEPKKLSYRPEADEPRPDKSNHKK